ncbi:MAG: 50S ribosomal protein L23 [Phycisphaerales bacterium]
MESFHVIKKPMLTEKATFSSNEHNRYGFVVDRTASKTDIKRAIEELYNVRVLGVSTHNRRSRDRRMRYGMVPGKTTKRAVVRIHPDDTIDLF